MPLLGAIDWASRPEPGEPSLVCFKEKVTVLMSASPEALGGLRGLVYVRYELEHLIMKEFVLSLVAGWIVGVLFGWLKLPLPAPPLMGFVGALGILLGAWSIDQLKQLVLH